MELLYGRKEAEKILGEVENTLDALEEKPTLAVLLVGDDAPSHKYVSLKKSAAEKVGLNFILRAWPQATTEQLIREINNWNQDENITGILAQLPLPKNIDTDKVIGAIDPKKDVDCFHPDNQKYLTWESNFLPPVFAGIKYFISVVIARSGATWQSLSIAFNLKDGIFKTALEQFLTSNSAFSIQNSEPDILITGLGQPQYLKSEAVPASVKLIIDMGATYVNGKLFGDVALESFTDREIKITAPSGGLGPLTVANLIKNVVNLAS